ncbi:hypothetical protein EVAR_66959_1 [Eumeta japonica]|uniref:Uncharacterized protein n=1 Tax=Eumeta variegata TaxID=151549 RepID=A0A4C1ZVZ5_EUMVA|nr:hypothetical protein EVAR_66959_1 [Eumeta japonica]
MKNRMKTPSQRAGPRRPRARALAAAREQRRRPRPAGAGDDASALKHSNAVYFFTDVYRSGAETRLGPSAEDSSGRGILFDLAADPRRACSRLSRREMARARHRRDRVIVSTLTTLCYCCRCSLAVYELSVSRPRSGMTASIALIAGLQCTRRIIPSCRSGGARATAVSARVDFIIAGRESAAMCENLFSSPNYCDGYFSGRRRRAAPGRSPAPQFASVGDVTSVRTAVHSTNTLAAARQLGGAVTRPFFRVPPLGVHNGVISGAGSLGSILRETADTQRIPQCKRHKNFGGVHLESSAARRRGGAGALGNELFLIIIQPGAESRPAPPRRSHKGKGSRQDCGHYCAVSLLGVVGELYAKITIEGVVDETEIRVGDVKRAREPPGSRRRPETSPGQITLSMNFREPRLMDTCNGFVVSTRRGGATARAPSPAPAPAPGAPMRLADGSSSPLPINCRVKS